VTAAALVVIAYLLGSIPTAYLAGRWVHGIDIRRVGSGNVGGSNLRAVGTVWETVVVGILDVLKAALAVWLALRLGADEATVCACALTVVFAHDWSIWLGGQGGRGGACTLGVLAVLFPAGAVWVLVLMGVGKVLRTTAELHLLAVLTLPLLAWFLDGSSGTVTVAAGLVLLMVVKRLEANRGFRTGAANGDERVQIYRNRLLLDRDRR
jgi:glycerol-3-phosphate acyltransferase PlsY